MGQSATWIWGVGVAAVSAVAACVPGGDVAVSEVGAQERAVELVRVAFPPGRIEGSRPAVVEMPAEPSGAFAVADAESGVGVRVALAREVGAEVVVRGMAHGIEDFVVFERRPAAGVVEYVLTPSAGVAGLRLVERTLELLDAGGAPRLRVPPPFLVDHTGARHDARLAVSGCAVDTNPAAPWQRATVAPGAASCRLRVTWDVDAPVYPAVLDPSWVTTGDMIVGHYDHASVLLSTARVLVTGGQSGGNTAELYDPFTGTWAATGSMIASRAFHTATELLDRRVLVAGSGGRTAEIYDPATGTWSAAGMLAVLHTEHTASLLSTGRVLVAGGTEGGAVAELFDPVTRTWSTTASMSEARGEHSATVLLDYRVLVAGGIGSGVLRTAELYDPATGTWTATGSLTIARWWHTATLLGDGRVLVAGGAGDGTAPPFDPTAGMPSAEIYDPATGAWGATGEMRTGRFEHTASYLVGGRVLVAGGEGGGGMLDSAEIWDPATRSWTTTASLSTARRAHTANVLTDGRVLVAGSPAAPESAEVFDPAETGAANGTSCTAGTECTSTYCVDGVCCDTTCGDGAADCSACSVAAGGATDGVCGTAADGTACTDFSPCTTADACVRGECRGMEVYCPMPSDSCGMPGLCDPLTGECGPDLAMPDGTTCDDGTACTRNDACVAGRCTGEAVVTCTAPDECHAAGTCDPATVACTAPPALPDGTSCGSGGACRAGVCVEGGEPDAGPPAPRTPDSGCGCHVPSTRAPLSPLCWVVLALVIIAVAGRRVARE